MSRRPSVVMDIEVEPEEPLDDEPDALEQQELEDLEGTEVNESEFIDRL